MNKAEKYYEEICRKGGSVAKTLAYYLRNGRDAEDRLRGLLLLVRAGLPLKIVGFWQLQIKWVIWSEPLLLEALHYIAEHKVHFGNCPNCGEEGGWVEADQLPEMGGVLECDTPECRTFFEPDFILDFAALEAEDEEKGA